MNRPCAVSLRPALAHDARALAEMSRALIEAGLAWRYTPSRMMALIRDPETMVLIGESGNRIQAFAVMQFGDEDAHLALLCVQPAGQRRGTGRRLIEWLVRSAQVAGIGSIQLELRADNDAALAFYRHLGFEETALVRGYYDGRIAARRMALRLGAPVP